MSEAPLLVGAAVECAVKHHFVSYALSYEDNVRDVQDVLFDQTAGRVGGLEINRLALGQGAADIVGSIEDGHFERLLVAMWRRRLLKV